MIKAMGRERLPAHVLHSKPLSRLVAVVFLLSGGILPDILFLRLWRRNPEYPAESNG